VTLLHWVREAELNHTNKRGFKTVLQADSKGLEGDGNRFRAFLLSSSDFVGLPLDLTALTRSLMHSLPRHATECPLGFIRAPRHRSAA
jgi:hypothetical protein